MEKLIITIPEPIYYQYCCNKHDTRERHCAIKAAGNYNREIPSLQFNYNHYLSSYKIFFKELKRHNKVKKYMT